MTLQTSDLAHARQAIASVLDELGLDAYLFEVEPRDDIWELKIECATAEGWGSFTLQLPQRLITAAPGAAQANDPLLQQCRQALTACKRKP